MSLKSPNPSDQRVQRTHQRLREAFISLVHERGYDALTIRDVAERAGVGRSTFYTHFGDLQELHDRWLKEFSAEKKSTQPLSDFTRSFLEHAHPQRGKWHALSRKKSDIILQRRFRQTLAALAQKDVKQTISTSLSSAVLDAVSCYLAGAHADVLFGWIDGQIKLSHGEIETLLRQLTTAVLRVTAINSPSHPSSCSSPQSQPRTDGARR